MPVGGGGGAPGGPEQKSELTLRERRVRANDTGRDGILMPGCSGAPRGPAANPITGIAARSRKRVQFTPSQSSLTEVSDGFEDTEPEAGTRDEGSRVSQAGAVSESGAGVGGAGGVGVEGSLSGSTVSHTQPGNPRRLMSFGSFSFHPVSQASDNSFSRSLLTSGSELIDIVSNYLPGFPSSRPSTPCNSSPTQRLPLSPRSLARTVSAEMCSSGGDVDSCTPGTGQCDLVVPLPPRQMGDPAVLAPYSTIESGAIPILPTVKLPGGKLPPIMSPRLSGNEAEQSAPRPVVTSPGIEFCVSAYSGSSAHAALLEGLSSFKARPVVKPLVPERERKRAMARLRSAKLIQEAWRRHRHQLILTSQNQESMQKALMSEIVTQEIFSSRQAGEPQTPLVIKHGSEMNHFHDHTADSHSAQNYHPPLCKKETPPRLAVQRMGSKPLTPNVSEAVAKDLFGTSISHTKSPRGPAGQASDLEAVDLEMGQDIPGGSAQQASHGLYSRFTCWLGCCHGNGPEQKNASFTTINGVHVITPPRPSVDVARKYASTRLARQRQGDENPGELYPLYTPLQTFDRFGTDISQYMHFIYYTSRLFFCLFFLNLSNLVINMEGGNLSFLKLGSAEAGVNPLAVLHTIGNTETTGVLAKGGHSYGVVELVTGAILVCYLYWLRGKMSEIRSRIRNSQSLSTLTAADFTVMVSDLPDGWRPDDIRSFFERFGEVVHVSLALNNRQLILEMKRTTELRDRHTEASLHLLTLMSKYARRDAIVRARSAAIKSLNKLERHRRDMRTLVRGKYRHTGYAFVTFNKAAVAREVVRRLTKGGTDEQRLGSVLGEPIRVKRAPEPSDVIWENLQYSKREQALRQTASTLTMCVIAAAGIFGIFSSNFFIAPGVNPTVSISSTIQYLGQMLGSLLVNVAGHIFFFLSVLALAKLYERQHSHGDKEKEMMIKMTVFQVLSIVMQAVLFLYIEVNANQYQLSRHQGRFGAAWYVSGAQVVLVALVGDTFVINLGMDLFRPVPDLVNRYIFARKAKTQAKMNELWSIDADVTLGFRVQLMNKIVVVGLMFSFAIPLLYLLIFFYLWSAHWVDRYIFLRRLTPPPVTHDGLMEVVLNYIFPAAIMLHLVMSVIFFNDICAGSKNADNDVCNKIFGDTFYNSSNSSTWDNLFLPNTTRLDTCTAMPSERLDLSNPDALYAVFAAQDDWQKRMRDDSMFDFASATIHSLECLVSNASQTGALCVEMSGCSLSLSGAHIVLILGCAIFSFFTILYVFLSTEGFKRRRDRSVSPAAVESHSATANFFLQVYRFLLQRDVHVARQPPHAHQHARIWVPGTRRQVPTSPTSMSAQKVAKPGKPEAHRSRVYTTPAANSKRDVGSSKASSAAGAYHPPPILSADSPMYLPPLTRALLGMHCSNARLDRRLLKSYLHITQPALEEVVGTSNPSPREESSIMERMRSFAATASVDQVRARRDMLRSELERVEHELSIRDGVSRAATKIGQFASMIGDLPGLPNVRHNVRRRMGRSPTNDELLPSSPVEEFSACAPLASCADSSGTAGSVSSTDSCPGAATAAVNSCSAAVNHTL